MGDDDEDCCYNWWQALVYAIYAVACVFTFVLGCLLLGNGLEFNEAFETTRYASLLFTFGFLFSPFGIFLICVCTVLIPYRDTFLASLVLLVYFIFVVGGNIINQSFHVAHYRQNIDPFDIKQPPNNEFEEKLMNFVVATFAECCEIDDISELLCEETNFTFPCILDETEFSSGELNPRICKDVEGISITLCEVRLNAYADEIIAQWKSILGQSALILFVFSVIVLVFNPLWCTHHFDESISNFLLTTHANDAVSLPEPSGLPGTLNYEVLVAGEVDDEGPEQLKSETVINDCIPLARKATVVAEEIETPITTQF